MMVQQYVQQVTPSRAAARCVSTAQLPGEMSGPSWTPDEDATECMLACGSPAFGVFWTRRHCAQCGRVVCSSCVAEEALYLDRWLCEDSQAPKSTGWFTPQQVCTKCFREERFYGRALTGDQLQRLLPKLPTMGSLALVSLGTGIAGGWVRAGELYVKEPTQLAYRRLACAMLLQARVAERSHWCEHVEESLVQRFANGLQLHSWAQPKDEFRRARKRDAAIQMLSDPRIELPATYATVMAANVATGPIGGCAAAGAVMMNNFRRHGWNPLVQLGVSDTVDATVVGGTLGAGVGAVAVGAELVGSAAASAAVSVGSAAASGAGAAVSAVASAVVAAPAMSTVAVAAGVAIHFGPDLGVGKAVQSYTNDWFAEPEPEPEPQEQDQEQDQVQEEKQQPQQDDEEDEGGVRFMGSRRLGKLYTNGGWLGADPE